MKDDDKILSAVLMRHGNALSRQESGATHDSERILSDEGRKNAFHSTQNLKQSNFSPDIIITSPCVRAVQTAEIVAETFDKTEIQILPELAAPASTKELLKTLIEKAESKKSFIAIGHMPTLGFLAELIVPPNKFNFSPAAFARVEIDIEKFLEHSENYGKLMEFHSSH